MKKYYEKYEILISILLIIIYIILNSFCLQNFGIMDYRTMTINTILCILIICFIIYNKLGNYYNLNSFPNPKKFLYFIPLIIIMTINFGGGISIKNSPIEIIIYIINMIAVSFLEEIIFRGFLFQMIAKDNLNRAILVTSITFGIGHILNLVNGADIIPTLIQICYSLSIGYLFAIILHVGKSLWPCIITHAVVNSLSIFNNENIISLYITPVILILLPILYSNYLKKQKL